MGSDLFFDNKKYISVKDAAALTSYSKDYVGQLCRHNKVLARRIGHTWYVCEDSILEYKNSPTTFDFSQNFYGRSHNQPQPQASVSSVEKKVENFYEKKEVHVPVVEEKGEYKYKVHKSPFYYNFELPKKLVPLVLILTAGIIFFNTITQKNISRVLTSLPQNLYDDSNEIGNLYSGKLKEAYLGFSDTLNSEKISLSQNLSMAVKNPPAYIFSTLKLITSNGGKILGGSLSLLDNTVSNFDLPASVNLASSAGTLSPFDHAGLIVYNGLNNWFSKSVLNPLVAIFSPAPSVVNNIVTPKITPSPIAMNTPTPAYSIKPTPTPVIIPTPKPSPLPTPTPTPVTRIIERIVEPTYSGISSDYLEQRLSELNNNILAQFSSLSTGNGGNITNVYQEIAQSQRIDTLSNTTINNPTINGGTISNTTINTAGAVGLGSTTVTNLIVTNTSTSTFSGGIDVTGGCITVNGTCLGTGSGSSGYSLVQDEGNPLTARNTFNFVGAGVTASDSGSLTTVTISGTSFTGAAGSVVVTDGSGALIATGTQLTVGNLLATSTTATSTLRGGLSVGANYFNVLLNGNVGVGTGAPTGLFDVNGKLVVSNSGFGTTTVTGLNINGSATTTSNVGLNISGGCFAINGTCLSTSGSFSNTIGNGGTGSTSFSPNSIVVSNSAGTALIATGSQLTVGNLISTTTNTSYFLGTVGVGTSNPSGLFDVNGKLTVSNTGFGTTTLTGLNINASATTTSNVGLNIAGGCFAINGTCLSTSAVVSSSFAFPWTVQTGFNSTSTVIGFTGGLFSTASSTFSGPLHLSTITGSFLGTDTLGNVYGLSTSSIKTSQLTNDSGFLTSAVTSVTGTWPIISSGGNTPNITFGWSTTSQPSSSNLVVSNGASGFYGVGTSTLTASSPLTGSFTQIGSGGSLGCQTVSASQAGCLSIASFNTFTDNAFPFTVNTGFNSTTTVIGFNGLFSTASSTFSGPLHLPTITSSFLGTDSLGNVYGLSTSSIKTSQLTNDSGFLTSALSTYDAFSHPASGISATSSTLYLNNGLLSTASSTFSSSLRLSSLTAGQLNLDTNGLVYSGASTTFSGGLTYLNGNVTNSGVTSIVAGSGITVSGATGAVTVSNNNEKFATSTDGYVISPTGGFVAIGTTTSRVFPLSVASSTVPQLSLGDGIAGNSQFTFRTAGNNFYIATTSTDGLSTSTQSALTINTNGYVGIGSSTPGSQLSIGGILNVTSGTTTFQGAGGINIARGCYSQAGSCLTINSFSGVLGQANGGTGISSYSAGDILYADSGGVLTKLTRGADGLVLKLQGGFPSWQTDLTTGGGGGATAWSTSTNDMIIYPTDTTDILVLGSNATSTNGNILEVVGNSLFGGNVRISGTASTTGLSSGYGYFGVTATSSFSNTGLLTLSGSTAINSILSTNANGVVTATSTPTFGNFNATSTVATSTISTGGLAIGGSQFIVQQNSGLVGIGTLNPAGLFDVNSKLTVSNSGFGTTTVTGLNINASATSTSNVGFNITTGCFSINGICLSSSGAVSSSFAFPFTVNTGFNSTSTVIGFNGLFSTASSTFSNSLYLSSLSQGFAYLGSAGQVNTLASSSVKLSWFTNDAGFLTSALSSYDAFSHPQAGFSATTSSLVVGTSTAATNIAAFTVASSTASQLSLGDALAGNSQFTFRTAGNNFYLSTTSTQGTATSTTPALTINTNGYVGIGSTTPGSIFSINNVVNFDPATTSFSSIGGINLKNGCFSIGGTCLSSSAFPFTVNTGFNSTSTVIGFNGLFSTASSTFSSSLRLTSLTAGQLNVDTNGLVYSGASTTFSGGLTYLNGNVTNSGVTSIVAGSGITVSGATGAVTVTNNNEKFATSTDGYVISPTGGFIAIGTTTARIFPLTIGSSTVPQLSLSSGAGISQFTFRNAGGNLYIATTSTDGLSTSTQSALTINTNGYVGVGSSTPGSLFAVNGVVNFDPATTTFSSIGGINLKNGCFSIGGTCLSSSAFPFTVQTGFNSTSTVIGFNGLFSTASSTFSGPLHLPTITGSFLGTDSLGNVYGLSTSSIKTSQLTNDAGFLTTALQTYDGFSHNFLGQSATTTLFAIGTTTSQIYQLTLASSTVPQLSLGDALAGNSQFTFRTAGNNFYITTTTAQGVSTSSQSALTINSNGYVGIGSTTPGSIFSISNILNIDSSTTTFQGTGGINIARGCYSLAGSCLSITSFGGTLAVANGGTGSTFFSPNSILVSNSAGTALIATGTQLTVGNIIATTSATSFFLGKVGIGTTTPSPISLLNISTTTTSQLSLSGNVTDNIFNFRSIGNIFAISTSSPTTYATSTNNALTINANGYVGIGTTSPSTIFSIANILNVDSATTTFQGTGGINIARGCYSVNGTCLSFANLSGTVPVANGGTNSSYFSPNSIVVSDALGTTLIATGTQLTVGNIIATTSATSFFLGKVGIGTTTPWASLSINPIAGQASNQFVVGSSTGTNFIIDNSGNVGIGTTAPLSVSPLTVNKIFSGQNVVEYGGYFAPTFTNADSFARYGLFVTPKTTGAGTFAEVDGIGSSPNITAGTVTTLNSFLSTQNVKSGATISNSIGFRVSDATGAGTVVNQFGLYIDPLTVGNTNNYAVFVAGANNSYFGGNIGISDLTPGTALSVVGNAQIGFAAGQTAPTNGLVVNGNSGFGTSTVSWVLNAFSSTASQLALSAGAGISQFAFRNAGGNLYIATTTVQGNATTSLAALTILGTNGNIGIGSTTPWAQFAIQGNNADYTLPIFAIGSTTGVGGNSSFLRVLGNGNVGIGGDVGSTTSAFTQLTVTPGTTTPMKISSGTTGNSGRQSYVQGRYLYYVGSVSVNDFQIWDISNPATTTLMSVSSLSANGRSVYVQGKYAYLADAGTANAFEIFDVSNPSLPVRVGRGTLSNNGGYIYVQGRYAFIVDSAATNNFEVWDISNPSLPIRVNLTTLSGTGSGIYVQGNYAYMADNSASNNFEVWDISNPVKPFRTNVISLSGGAALNVYVQGRYAYVTHTGTSFEIIDISNPFAVVAISSGTTNAIAKGMFVQGRYAYLADANSSNSFEIWDISNPYAPQRVSQSTISGNGNSLFVQGRYAFVTDTGTANNIETFDIGGAYLQSLEAGGIETGSLTVRNNIFAVDAAFTGGLNIGQGLFSSGPLSIITASSTASSATTTNIFNITTASSTNSIFSVFGNGLIGIGTSTPSATSLLTIATTTTSQLSLSGNPTDNIFNFRSIGSTFAISTSSPSTYATSTNNALTINANGYVGIGTTSPGSIFSVNGVVNFDSATTTFSSIGGINLASGCFSIGGTCLTSFAFPFTVNTGFNSTSTVIGFNGLFSTASSTFSGPLHLPTITGSFLGTDSLGNVYGLATSSIKTSQITNDSGFLTSALSSYDAWTHAYTGLSASTSLFAIGTTTSRIFPLTIGSSTVPQLSLSSGAGISQFTFRNAGGNLYIATTSTDGLSTSTQSALTINTNGYVGIGSTTPGSIFSISNILNVDSSTTTFQGTGGINIARGCYSLAGSCLTLGSFGGTLAIANGGTGSTFFSPNSILVSNSNGTALIATGTQLTVGNIIATTTATSFFLGKVGIGTTTPWAQFSVNPNGLANGVPEFVVGSSSATHFEIDNTGGIHIGSAAINDGAKVDISYTNSLSDQGNVEGIFARPNYSGGNDGFGTGGGQFSGFYSTPISSGEYIDGASSQVNGFNSQPTLTGSLSGFSGVRVIGFNAAPFINGATWGATESVTEEGLSALVTDTLGTTGSTIKYGANLSVSGTADTNYGLYVDSVGATNNFGIYSNSGINYFSNKVEIGTTTPVPTSLLTIATTTTPQLSLSGNATDNIFNFRSIGSTFAISTSSPTTYATSTNNALTINANGYVGVGTTSPSTIFSIANILNVDSATTTFQGTGGINIARGCFSIGGTCLSTSGSSGYNLVQDEGNPLTARTTLNFVGAGVTAADSGGVTTVTISGTTFSGAANSIITTDASGGLIATGTQLTVGNLIGTTTATSFLLGKFGIGSTTPWGALSVNPDALGYLGGVARPEFVIGSSTATHLIVNGAGLVGIGTTSPFAKLSINQLAGESAFVIGSSTSASSVSFIVDKSQNVGIGTYAPGEKLEVVGNIISKGTNWVLRTSAADHDWRSVAYGNGMFVAVAANGSGDRVMTSPDGINWTSRTSAADNQWTSVTYGNGLFVAVSLTGTGNRVMTSPDGINWTSRTSAGDNTWNSVAYGNGIFVAVSQTAGTGNQVMTSPDGINWTERTSAADVTWISLTYGNGLFVAVGSGTGNGVMTSPDGINWTSRDPSEDNQWTSVTYGNGMFVAVALSGTNRVTRSTDGITWTPTLAASTVFWDSVTYGNGLFVAVDSAAGQVMTSPDGAKWSLRTSPGAGHSWKGVAYGNGMFVSVSSSTGFACVGDCVMTSGKTDYITSQFNNLFQGDSFYMGNLGIGTSTVSISKSYGLTSYSSTTPQLSLSAGGGLAQWTLRNAGGNFYLATTTVAGTATTSTSALTINGTTGAISLATTTAGCLNTSSSGLIYSGSCGAGSLSIGSAVTSGTAGSVLFLDGSGNLGQDNSNFFWNSTTKKLGLGTSTPPSLLTISPTATVPLIGLNPLLLLGTSTLSSASANGTYLGINSPLGFTGNFLDLQNNNTRLLNISGYGGFVQNISSTTAFSVQDGSGNSVFTVDTTQASANSGLDITAGATQSGNLFNIFKSDGTTNFLAVNYAGYLGVGTSTMNYLTTLASSTAPQLSLSAGAGLAQYVFRNAGGNFYLSTTTVAGTATSSTAALSIDGTSGTTTVYALNVSATGANATSTIEGNLNVKGVLKIGTASVYLSQSGLSFSGSSSFDLSNQSGQNLSFNSSALVISGSNNSVAIGTTTSQSGLTAFSTTTPQLTLSAGAGISQWTFRNAGGNFYLTTTTAQGIATSTVAALSLDSNGFLTLPANAGVGCAQFDANGKLTNTNTACGTSASSFSFPFTVQTGFNSTSTVIGFNGLFSTASSTFSGPLHLPTILSSFLGTDSLGNVYGLSTSSIKTSQLTNDAGFLTTALQTYDGFSHNFLGQSATTSLFAIGTTTSQIYQLTLASSTVPQLSLGDALAGNSQFTFRTAGNNFYITTTTAQGVSTSSQSALTINSNGYVGIGTSTPGSILSIANILNVTSATTTFQGTGGINIANGCFSVNSICVTGGVNSLLAGSGITLSSATGNITITNNNEKFSTSTDGYVISPTGGLLAIGTTTARIFPLTIASSTVPQLSLGEGTSTYQFTFRTAGNNFYVATTTAQGLATSTTPALTINTNGYIGVGTSTPGSIFSVNGVVNFDPATTSFSSIGGINLKNGCFSINGTCLPSGLLTYDAFSHNFATQSATSSLFAIGTTTSQIYQLTVASSTVPQLSLGDGIAGNSQFTFRTAGNTFAISTTTSQGVATSTQNALTINANGYVGIGTTTPGSIFSVNGVVNFDPATTSFSSIGGINLKNGCFSINGTCLQVGVQTLIAGSGITVSSATGNITISNNNEKFATSTDGYVISPTGGLLAIGTTTARIFPLTVASSTVPQLSLGDGIGGNSQFTFRTAGNNFYLATTSTQGTATSSVSALTINTNGYVGIGSTTPGSLFAINNVVNFDPATTSFSSIGGINIAKGCFSIAGTCLSTSAGSGYSIIQDEAGALTQRTTVNFTGAGVTCVDNSGSSRTDCTISGTSFTGAANSIITTDSSGSLIATGTQLTVGNLIATTTATSYFLGKVGVGTTTPWGAFSINPNALGYLGGTARPEFVIGSSSATHFIVDGAGKVGIGTSNPTSKLDVTGSNTVGSLGSEMIATAANRNFSGAGNWSGTGWTVSGGVFNYSNGGFDNATLAAANVGGGTLTDHWYQITFTVNTITSAPLYLTFGGSATGNSFNWPIGTYTDTEVLQATSDAADLVITPGANWAGSVDNISIKEVSIASTTVTFRGSDGASVEFRPESASSLFIGKNAGLANSGNDGGNFNLGIGESALTTNVSGGANTAIGATALSSNTTGSQNTAVGYGTLFSETGGTSNSAFGYLSLSTIKTTSSYNSAFGDSSLLGLQFGNYNTAFGYNSLGGTTSGTGNTAIGSNSGGLGSGSMSSTTLLGYLSGYSTTGSGNVLLGYQVGSTTTTGAQNVMLGYNLSAASTTASYTLNIGNAIFGTGIDGQYTTLSNASISIGTSTSSSINRLTIASSTGEQLALSAGAGLAQWAMRNAGGNFYLGTTTTQGLATSSIAALTILTNGQVGIGTNSPIQSSLLTLATTTTNQLSLVGNASEDAWAFRSIGNNLYIGTTSPTTYATSSTPSLSFIGNGGVAGRIGVSSSTPWGKFSIEMGDIEPQFVVSNQGSSSPSFYVGGVNSNGYVGVGTSTPFGVFSINPNPGANVPSFVVGSSTGTDFIITQNGNIGIGTTSPMAALTVVGRSISDVGLTSSIGATRGLYVAPLPTATSSPAQIRTLDFRAFEVAPYLFTMSSSTYTKNAYGSYFNAFTIGTTSPNFTATTTATLYITGAPIASSSNMIISTSTALLIDSGSVTYRNGVVTNAYGLQVFAPQGATNNYSATFMNGNLGIGTTSPWAQLSINPNALGNGVPEFYIGSTTATHLILSNLGIFGIGTATPTTVNNTKFAIVGDMFLNTSNIILGTSTAGAGGTTTINAIATTTMILNINASSAFSIGATTTRGQGGNSAQFAGGGVNAAFANLGEPIFNIGTAASSTGSARALSTTTIGFFTATTTGLYPTGASTGAGAISGYQNLVFMGNGKATTTMIMGKGSICVDWDGFCNPSATTTGYVAARLITTGATDLAENYLSNDPLEGGDVVAVSSQLNYVHKADSASDLSNPLGIISTEPGFLLGNGPDQYSGYPVALAGRVPAKVSTMNGNIKPGDYITLSPIPGVAMKATIAGNVIGQALEGYSQAGVGKITVFVKNTYYSGSFSNFGLTMSGNSLSSSDILQSFISTSTTPVSTVTNKSELTVNRLTASGEIITPKITSNEIQTANLYATTITSPTIDVINDKIAELQSEVSSSGNVSALNSEVSTLENQVGDHFSDTNYSLKTNGNVGMGNLPASMASDSAVCISADGSLGVNAGISTCSMGTNTGNVTEVSTTTGALDLVKMLKPVKFKYNGESNGHFGFIANDVDMLAPELVSHSASGTPVAVRYDEMTSVLAQSIQELDVKVSAIDARLTHLETMLASSSEATGTSGLSFEQIIGAFANQFETIGAKFANGIAYFKNVIADKFTVGSKEKPAGITIYDDVTGDPFCMKMHNGAMVSLPGDCDSQSIATSTPPTTATSTPIDISSPVISINGDNPAIISTGATYNDLGASVTDTNADGTTNVNLGLHFSVDGLDTPNITIDTSASTTANVATTTHTIIYSAVDGAGNWGYATRTVEVISQ